MHHIIYNLRLIYTINLLSQYTTNDKTKDIY